MRKTIQLSPSSDNMTPVFNKIFRDAQHTQDEIIIELEPKDYYFKRAGSEKRKLFSSGGRTCENYVLFPIENVKHLTIEGNGARFVYCDRIQPFLLSHSENIVLRNFSVDYSFYRYAFAEVLSNQEDGFEVKLDQNQFDYFVEDGFLNFVCGEDILSTKNRQISMRRIEPTKSNVQFLRVGNSEAPINAAAENIYVDAVKTETGVFLKFREENNGQIPFKKGDIVILAYDNSREAQAFYCEFSKNITLENITIHRSGGMGFVADLCEDIMLDGFQIRKKEGRTEYFTTTADGIFLSTCSGNFTLKNAYISDTYDDAINIHGFYTQIEEILSPKKVKLTQLHPVHWGNILGFPGDLVHISDPNTLNELQVLEIADFTYDEDRLHLVLTFQKEANLKPGMLIENPDRMPNVLLENNTICRCPHMRLSAGNMIIRNNTLALEVNDICIHDLIQYWGESGAVKHVEITGNTFPSTCAPNIYVDSYRPENSNRLHDTIILRNNSFHNIREKALRITHVNNWVEEDNHYGVSEI